MTSPLQGITVLELGTARLDMKQTCRDIAHNCRLDAPARQAPRGQEAVCPLCRADRT